jgi:hypothetical protein
MTMEQPKAKSGTKKPSRVKKAKTLKPVKPLDAPALPESISLNFAKIQTK